MENGEAMAVCHKYAAAKKVRGRKMNSKVILQPVLGHKYYNKILFNLNALKLVVFMQSRHRTLEINQTHAWENKSYGW